MMPNILFIPHELIHEVVSWLIVPDQAALARTCKFLNNLLTTLVWSEIELHHRGVHEGLNLEQLLDEDDASEDDDCPCTRRSSSRKYCQPERDRQERRAHGKAIQARSNIGSRDNGEPRATDNCNRQTYQDGRERLFLGLKGWLNPLSTRRWTSLGALVKSLCVSVAVDHEVSALLEDLVNLSSLQLVGLPLAEEWEHRHSATATSAAQNTTPNLPLTSLRRLRLRGYFPASFVCEILTRNASGLTHLDLGLLAGPWDDKANSYLAAEGDQDEDPESDDEIDEDEKQAWAPHSPHWLQASQLPAPLCSLTHLHLVKPSHSVGYSFGDDFCDMNGRYENAIYEEWGALLDSAAATLQEAIFEHRVPAEVGDTVTDGDPHPISKEKQNSRDRTDNYFCESILRQLLLGGRERFPHLQRLELRGIRIKGIGDT